MAKAGHGASAGWEWGSVTPITVSSTGRALTFPHQGGRDSGVALEQGPVPGYVRLSVTFERFGGENREKCLIPTHSVALVLGECSVVIRTETILDGCDTDLRRFWDEMRMIQGVAPG